MKYKIIDNQDMYLQIQRNLINIYNSTQPSLNYTTNIANREGKLGRWNGNFACWEN